MKNTTLVYIEDNGKWLMLHRTKKENDLNKDLWIGIGGHCEENESPEECVCREVAEETGLALTDYTYRGIITFVSDKYEGEYMHLFTANGFSGELTECPEGELEWIDINRIRDLPIWEGDRIFLELIQTPCPFFSLKLVYKDRELSCAILNGKEKLK